MRRINLFKLKTAWGRYLVTTLCAFMFGAIVAQAQVSVSGTVTSATDESPLPGVTIVIKGTANGTVTGVDGNFNIEVPDKSTVLVISSIGFLSEEVTVGDQTNIKVSMIEDITGLEEVVVIGYGTQKKKEVTGAVARVTSEDIDRIVTHDLGTALQGQISGVNITSSGAPGEASDVLIRGISTVGNNSPLYVVDGVPFDSDPRISPSEIESVDVLKDAASAAIYGARGAAGVILITTKQGKEGKLNVSFNATYGVQNIPESSHTPLMNATEDTYFNLVRNRNTAGVRDDETTLEIDKSVRSYQYDTDIRKTTFVENAPTQDYNIIVSGGTKSITYSVMAGYFDQKGVIINSHYKRFNTRANTTYKKGKWQIDANIGLTQGDQDAAAGGMLNQAIRYKPTSQDVSDINPGESMVLPVAGENIMRANWVIQSLNNTDNTTNTQSYANFNFNYDIIESLSISSRFGVNSDYRYREKFGPYQEIEDVYGDPISNPQDSYVENRSEKYNKLTWDAILKYQKSFGDHNITAQAIYTIEESHVKRYMARGEGVLDNAVPKLSNTSINYEVGSGEDATHKRIGTLGRILYNYKSRYMFNASGRYDASTRFGKENRWGFFPSLSAAWNLSEESFWSPLKESVNKAKFRISRGTTGNENIGNYAYSANIVPFNYVFGPEGDDKMYTGLTQNTFANPNVKWETSVMWNFGLDLAFLQNKIAFTAEYYDTKKEDMLFPVIVPSSSIGEKNRSVWTNIGNMTNRGYELDLAYKDRRGDFSWGVIATWAANKNKITNMETDARYIMMSNNALVPEAYSSSQVTVLAEGYEAASFFIFETDGIVDTPEKLAKYQQINGNAQMGDLIYVDRNGDGEITDDDRKYMGSGLPDYTTGLVIELGYRGFDFTMQWYAAIGHEIMNGASASAFGWGRHKDLVAQWSEATPQTPIPAYRADMKAHDNYKGYTDLWLEDGSYLRLKNLTFGYTLPKSLVLRANISKARIFVTGQNLLTFTNYRGYNPEISSWNIAQRGLDTGKYPIAQMVLVGLNLNF